MTDWTAAAHHRAGDVRLVTSRLLVQRGGPLHGFAERAGGVSTGRFSSLNLGPLSGDDRDRVRENRDRLLARIGVEGRRILAPRQVHSADISIVRASAGDVGSSVVSGDGVLTDRCDVALMILAADCVPVLLFDPERQLAGAVHAGWHGTAGGIAGRAVRLMAEAFGCRPSVVIAALGPAIGRCCYEVGPEVLAAVHAASPEPDLWDPLPDGKGLLDLRAANVAQLREAGISPEHIDVVGPCTACTTERFYSHRREGEPTGRNAAVIALA